MIKKSLICFFFLAILHLCVVLLFPSIGMATNQWQDNLVKAQNFMCSKKSDTVMVGTSLSGRIIRDSIPFVQSISFGGCAVEDGLKMVLAKGIVPKIVLIETNLLLLEGNPELVSKITDGPIPIIRRCLPSLREQYEPICILASLIMNSTNINPQAAMSVVNMDLLRESINRQLMDDKILPDSIVKARVKIIKGMVESLKVRGSKIVFFEMPVNESLYYLKRNVQIRGIMQKEFPVNNYVYLPSDTTKYLTTDGEHLDFEGQQRYSHFFRTVLREL